MGITSSLKNSVNKITGSDKGIRPYAEVCKKKFKRPNFDPKTLCNWMKNVSLLAKGNKQTKPPPTGSTTVPGKKSCPYCEEPFTPQGLSSHINTHTGDRIQPKTNRNGPVKIRGPLYSDIITGSDGDGINASSTTVMELKGTNGGDIGGGENNEGAVVDTTTANDDSISDDEDESEDEGENISNTGGTGLTEDDVLNNIIGTVLDRVMEESDDDVVARVAKKQKVNGRSTSGRSPQFTASRIVDRLDGYYKFIKKFRE